MEKRDLDIQLYGSPILRKKCRQVKNIDYRINQLLDAMVKLMKEKEGVGLAGNQAGLELALVVVEAPQKLYRLINPRITKRKGKITFDEGCLSFPELTLSVKRSEEIWVNYLDEQAKEVDVKAEGILAVILQHEIDHINGVLFIDRIPLFERLKIRLKLDKIKRLYKKGINIKKGKT